MGGEVLTQPERGMSSMQKLVALGGCAALVAVGYACGSWRAGAQQVRADEFLNKATALEQFGKDFSAATQGKSWAEIATITAQTKAGTGTLGASYSALSAADKSTFHTSASSAAAGKVSTVTNAPAVAAAKTAAAISSSSTESSAEAAEKKERAAAILADDAAAPKKTCMQGGSGTYDTYKEGAA